MNDMSGEEVPHASSKGTYARKATGLVREVSPFTTFVFNMAGTPTAVFLAVSIFFVLGLYPGGSIWLGFAMVFVLAIIINTCYGLFASAIPRSGGDYVLVSRLMHPLVGLISSFFWMAGMFLSLAFVAYAFVTVALGPSLTAVGLVSGHNSLVSAGNTLATSEAWQFGIAAAMILASAALLAGGWRWTARLLRGCWIIMMLGLAVVFFVLIFKTKAGFVHSFNEFAGTITGESDSYHGLIAAAEKEGVQVAPPFSMSNTWPTFAAIAGLSIYNWLSIYISGEVRRAKDTTQLKTMNLATTVHLGIAVLFAILFFWKFGHDFFVAANALSGSKAYPFAAPPYYTFLTSIAGGSTMLAWVLFVTFAVAYPLWILNNLTIAVRTVFAWSLDGILPSRFARVSPRTHAPNAAIALVVVFTLLVLWWAVSSTGFLRYLFEAVVLQLVTMILLGVAAVLLPYRRPDIWRASATTARFAGIPVISIAGGLAAVLLSGLFYLYMHYPLLGIEDKGEFLRDCAIILGAALLTFFGARWARLRQGVDVDKLAAEIPPE